MEIRKASVQDLGQIMQVYDKARKFMRENGNAEQWKGNLTAKVTSGETELKAGTDGIYALPVPEGKKASFTNVYDSTTSIKFAGTKALVNNTLSDSMPFEFVITGENDKRFTAVDPEGQEYSTDTK